jgi:hypothetical protein
MVNAYSAAAIALQNPLILSACWLAFAGLSVAAIDGPREVWHTMLAMAGIMALLAL